MTDRSFRPDLPEEARLRRLLDRTVADVEPADRLDAIRARTGQHDRTEVTPMSGSRSTPRPWIWGALGAAVATAAVIGGVALLGDTRPAADQDPSPVVSPSETTQDPSDTGSPQPSPEPSPSDTGDTAPPSPTDDGSGSNPFLTTVAVYYVGETPRGPRLYREFQRVAAGDPEDAALAAVGMTPLDPDYRTWWPEGALTTLAVEGDVIRVSLRDGSVHDRPPSMSEADARLAVEQVLYTAQAAVGQRLPVQFTLGGNPVDQVFGVPTSEPLAQGSVLEVLSLMSITEPAEGARLSGTVEVTGVNNGFEANVQVEVRDGNRVVASSFGTAEGAMGDRLYPWTVRLDLSGVAPGTYTLVASNDDPSGGAEGNGPDRDTRTIVIE